MSEPRQLPKLLQEVLGVSSDSAYRRLRGETALSLDEAYTLGNYFKVSLSDLESFRNDHVTFTRRPFITSVEQFQLFLRESLAHLKMLLADPNHLMLYMAQDVPIFYHYKFNELGAFKMFVWLRSIYDIKMMDDGDFNLSKIPQQLLELAQQQWEAYSKINALEIWNESTIFSLINQIEYYYEAGLLAGKEQALLICDQMHDMLKLIYKQALYGKRIDENGNPSDASYQLYYNEVLMLDNNILSRYNGRLIQHIPYAAVNYFTTTNEQLTRDTYNHMMRQANKALLIGEVSEKERNKFFLRLRKNIDDLRKRIIESDPFVI
jgi:hypothetical protein